MFLEKPATDKRRYPPLGIDVYVRHGRRLALAMVAFLLPTQLPDHRVSIQTTRHTGYFQQSLLPNDFAGSGILRATTSGKQPSPSLATTAPSIRIGALTGHCVGQRYCTAAAGGAADDETHHRQSAEIRQGLLDAEPVNDLGRATQHHNGPAGRLKPRRYSPGALGRKQQWRRWRQQRQGAFARKSRILGGPFRRWFRSPPRREQSAAVDASRDVSPKQEGTSNETTATTRPPKTPSAPGMPLRPFADNMEADAPGSSNTARISHSIFAILSKLGNNWRGHNVSIFAGAAMAAPSGGIIPSGAEQTHGQQRVEEDRKRENIDAVEYDGEEVSEETWGKVKALRRRAESCASNEDGDVEGLTWWLEKSEGGMGLTDVDLLRFIMFRHGDVDAAWEQLKKAGRWRRDQRADEVLSEERWADFTAGQNEIFWLARDRGGRPTLVLRSIAHLPGRIEENEFKRHLVYVLEQGRKLWGVGSEFQMNILIDRIGAGLKNQDPRLLGKILPVFRDAYPDVIYRCYVAPTSWIFRFVWVIGARLVDARQRKRVLLLSQDWKSSLLKDFDSSVLPAHLGGTLAEYPPRQPPNM